MQTSDINNEEGNLIDNELKFLIKEYLDIAPYDLDKAKKEVCLSKISLLLTKYHIKNCPLYKRMLKATGIADKIRDDRLTSYTQLPFLPVRLFKELTLRSCPESEVIKTMTSSGTTGQAVSKIYLDKDTATLQQQVLTKILSSYIGTRRLPMIIIDTPSVIKNRTMFSARGAGILGFMLFGSKKFFCLNDDMSLNLEGLREFINEHKSEKIFLFGFTFMIWQHFYQELKKLKDHGIDLSNGIMIHGGGWKKLKEHAVSSMDFNQKLREVCDIEHVYNYYGMVEQTGCIYMECEHGHLHASNFSDILIRNPRDFSLCKNGEEGIIEVVSSIPKSYPGHILLTEDLGTVIGEDDCPCGRKGKYFSISGRLKNAELRGCSDTYATKF